MSVMIYESRADHWSGCVGGATRLSLSTPIPPVDSSRGSPRSQRAVRDQVRIEMRSLDPLPPADDPARVMWEFVRKLDLSEY